MYVVVRDGVERNTTVGLYTSLNKARDAAAASAALEEDEHHSFTVLWIPVNQDVMEVPDERTSAGRDGTWLLTDRIVVEPPRKRGQPQRYIPTADMYDPGPDALAADPLLNLAYRLLARDPVAMDAAEDVLTKGG